jgi:heme/copper-type cytochrome/quinol oxidase subunit 2
MCRKGKFTKICALLLIGICAVSFSLTGSNHGISDSPAIYEISQISAASDPLAFLFQIIFILFFISPPVIALLLFLIWRELKERNRMK